MVSMTMIFLSTKIRFSFFCLLFIGIWLFPLSVSANAMPSTWAGTGGLELWVAEDCPVEVERERLTLRLDGRKTRYTLGCGIEAVYTLHNPADTACSFPAVFPVVLADGQPEPGAEAVRLDGEPLDFEIRSVSHPEEEIWDGLTAEELLEGVVPTDSGREDGAQVRLLLFQLELGPGETRQLSVETGMLAFMEQERLGYLPLSTRYTFYYFLSPAQYWADFGEICIDLRLSDAAPLLSDSSLDLFPVAPGRYLYRGGSLPEGELVFTVRSSYLMTAVIWLNRLGIAAALVLIIRKSLHRIRRGKINKRV